MKKRIIGAVIIVAIVLPILLKGGLIFSLLSLVLGLMAFIIVLINGRGV